MGKYKAASKVLLFILVINLLVAGIKIGIGFFFNLNSLTADGYHAISDSTANIVGLIGLKLASKPADKKHPYGYHKFETIAGLIIGFMLFGITIQIITKAIKWFISPVIPIINVYSIIAIVITIILNTFVAIYEYKKGKKLNSEVLISDSIHTRSDIVISFGVVVTMILISLGVAPIIDPILSLIIAVFIFHSCWQILKSNMKILVDSQAVDENYVKQIIYETDIDILDVHKVRSRGHRDFVYIDLHIIIPEDKTVKYAHDLSHKIQKNIINELQKQVEVIAHIEPENTDNCS